MEKVAGAGKQAEGRWEYALGCVAALAGSMVSPALHAQEAGKGSAEVLVAEARVEGPRRVQVQTSTLPRFDAQDAGFQAPRVDFALTPHEGASGLGAVLGMSNPGAGSAQTLGLQPRTAVDLGVRWTQRLQSQRQIDITAWRRLNNPDDAYSMALQRNPTYGARVELNLTPVRKTGLALDRGFVGLQMEGGARITIKRKDGRPMVYYRTTF